MFISGKCGFDENCSMRSDSLMSSGETPGKCSAKKDGTEVEGLLARRLNVEEGAKSVHVKERSREGIAMNMKEEPGQMCRWCGEMAKSPLGAAGMWNSHQSVSMYSWR